MTSFFKESNESSHFRSHRSALFDSWMKRKGIRRGSGIVSFKKKGGGSEILFCHCLAVDVL